MAEETFVGQNRPDLPLEINLSIGSRGGTNSSHGEQSGE
jgi:hypothetical protein